MSEKNAVNDNTQSPIPQSSTIFQCPIITIAANFQFPFIMRRLTVKGRIPKLSFQSILNFSKENCRLTVKCFFRETYFLVKKIRELELRWDHSKDKVDNKI